MLALGAYASRRGSSIRACLSEATGRVPEGPALGFDLVLYEASSQKSGGLVEVARTELARRPPPIPGEGPVRERLGPFAFSDTAFARAAAFLAEDPAERAATAVDEIGPLELRGGGGFSPVLDLWEKRTLPGVLIATVRPALARELAVRLGSADCAVVSLDELSEAEAARAVAAHVDALTRGGLGFRP